MLGAELLGEALLLGGAVAVLTKRSVPRDSQPSWLLARWAVIALGTLPLIIGGVSVIAETGGGLYWTAAGMVSAIAGGVANAWVLLVEILR